MASWFDGRPSSCSRGSCSCRARVLLNLGPHLRWQSSDPHPSPHSPHRSLSRSLPCLLEGVERLGRSERNSNVAKAFPAAHQDRAGHVRHRKDQPDTPLPRPLLDGRDELLAIDRRRRIGERPGAVPRRSGEGARGRVGRNHLDAPRSKRPRPPLSRAGSPRCGQGDRLRPPRRRASRSRAAESSAASRRNARVRIAESPRRAPPEPRSSWRAAQCTARRQSPCTTSRPRRPQHD